MMPSLSVLEVPVCEPPSVLRKLASTLPVSPNCFLLEATLLLPRVVLMQLSESRFLIIISLFIKLWLFLNYYQHAQGRLEMAHVRHREGFGLAR